MTRVKVFKFLVDAPTLGKTMTANDIENEVNSFITDIESFSKTKFESFEQSTYKIGDQTYLIYTILYEV